MSTVNGFGTLFYDWEHFPDAEAEATSWLVAAFLPVIPLGRYRVVVHTTGEKPSFFSFSSGSFRISYSKLRRVPNSAYQILRTYIKGWILTPIVLLCPVILEMWIAAYLMKVQGLHDYKELGNHIFWLPGLAITYWAFVVSSILDRTSGRASCMVPLPENEMPPGNAQ